MTEMTLDQARRSAAELQRLQQAAAQLPALEAAEQERQRRAGLRQRLGALEPAFEAQVSDYLEALGASNLALKDLVNAFLDVLQERQELGRLGEALLNTAHNLARFEYESTHPPASSSYDLEDERLHIQGAREQLLIERGCWPLGYFGKVRSLEVLTLLSALSEFVPVLYDSTVPAPLPEPIAHDAGRVEQAEAAQAARGPVEGGVQRLLEIANASRPSS